MSTPILAIIENNVVTDAIKCIDAEELENRFADEILARGIEPTDNDFANGEFHFEDGTTVCIFWADFRAVEPSGKRTL